MMKMKYKMTASIKPFPFYLSDKLKRKLELLLAQLEKKDVWILIDGSEGSGKSNTAAYLLYWFHCMTGREFTLDRFYFDSDEMLNWAINNSYGLINWDEAALGGLSIEWWRRSQINLIKFGMVGRIKHHVFVMCIPRFTKLKEELRLDRIHALIHMDCGKANDKYGNFIYLTRRGIRYINMLWKTKHITPYFKVMRKTGGFFGWIPYVFNKILDEEEYNKKKMVAIATITKNKDEKRMKEIMKLREYRRKILGFRKYGLTINQIAETMGVSPWTINYWLRKTKGEENENEEGIE